MVMLTEYVVPLASISGALDNGEAEVVTIHAFRYVNKMVGVSQCGVGGNQNCKWVVIRDLGIGIWGGFCSPHSQIQGHAFSVRF